MQESKLVFINEVTTIRFDHDELKKRGMHTLF